jgi:superfamily II DNA or RNA helicase
MSIGEPVGLYDYQEEALRAGMAKNRGVIIMPCGSGKTQVGLALAARRGTSTLWLTHTHDLLKQSMDRAVSMFGLSRSDIGTITGGRVDISKTITFATVQTMVGIDLTRHADAWGTIIVDECHHAIGAPTRMMMFYKVLSALNAQFRYGLTATPDRADGLEAAMYALIGPALVNISRDRVAHNTVPVNVQFAETGYAPDIAKIIGDDGVFDNAKAQRMLSEDEARNTFISGIVESLVGSGKSVLVLTSLVAHANALAGMYGGYVLAGRVAKKQRDAILNEVRSRDVPVLYATYQLAKEGLDIPRLGALVCAMPVWDETTVIQSAGRVSRRFEGKTEGVVIDLVDDFEMYRRKARKRARMYEGAGYTVARRP